MARIALFLLAALALAACGGPTASDTPEGTVQKYLDYCRDRKFEEILSLVHPDVLREADEEVEERMRSDPRWRRNLAQRYGIDEDEFEDASVHEAWAMMAARDTLRRKEGYEALLSAVISRTETDGDKARVYLTVDDATDSIGLLRHEGRWYLETIPHW